ncbi:ATP-binding cassette domain-containing protein [Petrocella sp. FN5]|uniref:ATP-binding cassette domain-containing protein n=1 Tax=Petrocella sp. FN5 TaxID=3032002 RepID=UPI0023DC90FE|nr:ABC transporter ATP-binding protein [Petrocella sp. FN5]MDF1615882.1 ABC transporter ATP-binding protein [Petrocella sp. FN5]
MNNIELKNITKYYNANCALQEVSLIFEEKRIYGLLGRNGAGKTTLLNLITNRIFPTKGYITLSDLPIRENDALLERIFYMTESNLYPESMKIHEVFRWTQTFYSNFDLTYANRLCEKFDLNPNKKFKALSTGYNTIAKLIIALASNAEMLIFDEPILGLDAHHRTLFYKELLAHYIKTPKTIILSTHIIEEIADLLEWVVILGNQKVLINESVASLMNRAYAITGKSSDVEAFVQNRKALDLEYLGNYCKAILLEEPTEDSLKLMKQMGLEQAKVGLQELFIKLTNVGGVHHEISKVG